MRMKIVIKSNAPSSNPTTTILHFTDCVASSNNALTLGCVRGDCTLISSPLAISTVLLG